MKATMYVQFEADYFTDGAVRRIRAVRLTQSRPTDPLPGSVLARLVVDVPEHLFEPIEAEGVLVADHLETIPVEQEQP